MYLDFKLFNYFLLIRSLKHLELLFFFQIMKNNTDLILSDAIVKEISGIKLADVTDLE